MRAWPVLLVILFLAPTAAAQEVRLWLDPPRDDVEGMPDQQLHLEYQWNIEFVDTTCPAGTEFGVDFFPDGPSPAFGGASFSPAGALARFPNVTSGTTTLELFVSDDAPVGQSTTFELGTGLGMQNAGACTPEPTRNEETASLTLAIAEPAPSSDSARGGGNGLAAPGVLAGLAALGAAVMVRSRG